MTSWNDASAATVETNLGSGVIIGSEGYILTNQHVIDGADEILISLADGRGSQAVLIGEDKDTDIAILQIPITGLTGIKVADIASDSRRRRGAGDRQSARRRSDRDHGHRLRHGPLHRPH